MSFDPDAIALANGEGHLIPPPVRRLSAERIHALFPDEFHVLRGREACDCDRDGADTSTSPRPRPRGAIEL